MDFARHLKDSVDIVAVMSHYVRLRKAAENRWSGLCPFRRHDSSAFHVHGGLKFYKCFRCGSSGDAVKFVQDMEGVTFQQAIAMLAERYNIVPPEPGASASEI